MLLRVQRVLQAHEVREQFATRLVWHVTSIPARKLGAPQWSCHITGYGAPSAFSGARIVYAQSVVQGSSSLPSFKRFELTVCINNDCTACECALSDARGSTSVVLRTFTLPANGASPELDALLSLQSSVALPPADAPGDTASSFRGLLLALDDDNNWCSGAPVAQLPDDSQSVTHALSSPGVLRCDSDHCYRMHGDACLRFIPGTADSAASAARSQCAAAYASVRQQDHRKRTGKSKRRSSVPPPPRNRPNSSMSEEAKDAKLHALAADVKALKSQVSQLTESAAKAKDLLDFLHSSPSEEINLAELPPTTTSNNGRHRCTRRNESCA